MLVRGMRCFLHSKPLWDFFTLVAESGFGRNSTEILDRFVRLRFHPPDAVI